MTDGANITSNTEPIGSVLPEPNTIADREIQDAKAAGAARPLSPIITDFMHFRGHWWLACEGYWLRVTDAKLAAALDDHEVRFNGQLLRPNPSGRTS